ncbi:HAD family phosphatase [Nakamurella flava]|uniref:HAD family phosphatase n=1 Tax=Nakamurella flava TaxID=2576308 RepID=A0A4U6QA34_9ACTN|nr:HAD family hydrolase [Nakamurella flava]TKV56771.1 HAD family phosphatase [Nakamurella flava]
MSSSPSPVRSAAETPPRLIVTDMDGTLLDASGMKVSDRNMAALRRAQDAGVPVVIATGRPIWWLTPVLEAGFTGVAVCMNGAIVYDVGADDIIAASPLTPEVMQTFIGRLTELDPTVSLAVERLGTTLQACIAEESYDHPWAFGYFQRSPRETLLAEPVAKLLVRGRTDSRTLAAVAQEAADTMGWTTTEDSAEVDGSPVHITWSTDDGLIEVAAAGVNKGAALDRLAARWDIDPAHAIAFGDMPNDLEMFAWAGRAVAMGNAHNDVVAVADEIAADHHDDGVARVLERWF